MQKFRQSSTVFEKPSILSENLETLTRSDYHTVQYFLLKPRTRFLLTNVYKRVCRSFLFCLDLELFAKIRQTWFLHTRFYIFSNNSRSKKNKKIPNSLFQTLLSRKRVQNFSKKISNSMVVRARQSFQFFRKKIWFLGNNRPLP